MQGRFLPPVLLQELPDEALGQLARVAEELLVKVVVHGRDVSESFLLGFAEERRRSAQTETSTGNTFTLTANDVSARTQIPVKRSDDLQDICDDPDAPAEKKYVRRLIQSDALQRQRGQRQLKALTTCLPPSPAAHS